VLISILEPILLESDINCHNYLRFTVLLQKISLIIYEIQYRRFYMPNTQQIGKAGELLLQYKLLLHGIESAPMTTDSGVDLVAYSSSRKDAITIQVKTNLKPKPGGGRGKLALDWWIPEDSPAQLIAVIDLSCEKIWLFTLEEVNALAQQHPKGRYHLCMAIDPTMRPIKKGRLLFDYEFEQYRLENRLHKLF
jgi:hypothetical protein